MKKKLAVLFGGVTTEHEVSVITGVQFMSHVNRDMYELTPVYIDKAGKWWTGEKLTDISYYRTANLLDPSDLTPFHIHPVRGANDIEVAILCFHGEYGESGNIQGLLELAGIAYQGPGVTGSMAAFDKIITRQILTAEQIGQTNYVWFTANDWREHKQAVLDKVATIPYPLFIKPSRSGSSIGIVRITEPTQLEEAVKQVLLFDNRVIIEEEVKDCIEVNVSVLGGNTIEASATEQPIKADEFLSFADKYEKGGGKKQGMASSNRRIPAPISSSLNEKVQELAKKLFRMFDCYGVVRIDFFVDPSEETIYVTELNTIPGSMSFYLWEASGLPYPQLVDRLVAIAEEKFAEKNKLVKSFETNILQKQI